MNLNTLKPALGEKSLRKRVGRGMGSGMGKTAGRGHKGQKSRSGGFTKIGFEGGQMPLQRRIPKFGFKNINRVEYNTINIDDIQTLIDDKKIKKELTIDKMIELRLIKKGDLVKILGRGKIDAPIIISAHKFSASAEKLIEKAGGKITII